MSIFRSYFNQNNTIVADRQVNTGRNPIMDLTFGASTDGISTSGFTRFIFNIDLQPLLDNITGGTISRDCTTGMTHTLNMTNTIRFDDELLNTYNSDLRLRATSFDLILFRIPKTSGSTGIPQYWDEGVGYDYVDTRTAQNSGTGTLASDMSFLDRNYSLRPSNWYRATTLSGWSTNGIYYNSNGNNTGIDYSAVTIVDIQHFEFGNEDIQFDMTNEINSIINGTLTGYTGWGIAYRPELETITGLTSNYSVSFFTRHTQTFYEPYLLTNYNDLVQDDRNNFTQNSINKLYLYVNLDGDYSSLDNNPLVSLYDSNGDLMPNHSGLTTCERTKGVYEVVIPVITGYTTPCTFNDVWYDLSYASNALPDVENELVLRKYSSKLSIGTESKEPKLYGFDFYGIKQDELILNTDIRKVGVIIKKAYTQQQELLNIDAQYRIYVREGTTEVQVQDWTQINKSVNEYYFIFDTRDKIPNEYFIDIKVKSSGEVNTYKRQLKFQIVNKK